MTEEINEKIDVITVYKRLGNVVFPVKICWNGKYYVIKKLGYHHREKIGGLIYHIFHVSSNTLSFRLRHNPLDLQWTLEEVSDGTTN